MTPPGWSAFDPHVVGELQRARSALDAPCPLRGHDHRIPWGEEGYTKGTVYHGDPPVSFRVSPTYVLEDHLKNFIVGRELVDKLSGKAETWRLGNENSEDALSFSVFRSLQEAGRLTAAARVLTGVKLHREPELIVWGHRLDETTVHPIVEFKTALNNLEGTSGQQTEPDLILRIPGWGWIFVEAKLASPTSTYKGRPAKLTTWKGRYATSGLFDLAALAAADQTHSQSNCSAMSPSPMPSPPANESPSSRWCARSTRPPSRTGPPATSPMKTSSLARRHGNSSTPSPKATRN